MNSPVTNFLRLKEIQVDKNARIKAVTIWILIGFLIGSAYHFVQGTLLGKPYPYSTFLFAPWDRFNDFFSAVFNSDLNPYFGLIPSAQYPLINLIDFLFTLLPLRISLAVFMVLVSLGLIFFATRILWGEGVSPLKKMGTLFPLIFLSYPFLFAIDRGNLELLLCVFLLAFTYTFLREKYSLSAFFLAVAIAMKAFPGVLILLFLAKRKFREAILTIVITGLLTLGSLLTFKGGLMANVLFLLHGSNFSFPTLTDILGQTSVVQRGVNLFSFCKIILIETGLISRVDMAQFLSVYIKIAAISFLPIAAYIYFIERILWRQMALLVFAMLLLPQISADYKLIHVFLPLFLFLISDDHSSLSPIFLAIFALLMVPKDYWYFPHVISDSVTADISIAVPMNILLMVAMDVLIITSGTLAYFKTKSYMKQASLRKGGGS